MSKAYYKMQFILFTVALSICGVCRIILKLFFMDPQSGLYLANRFLAPTFNLVLVVTAVVLYGSSRIRKADNDFSTYYHNPLGNVLSILVGGSVAVLVVGQLIGSLIRRGAMGQGIFMEIGTPIALLLGGLTAFAFVQYGLRGMRGSQAAPNSVLLLMPCLWQLIQLLLRFKQNAILPSASDNLLLILFMTFCTLFLMGHSRTVCGMLRRDGRNYTIPTGLCTALFGLLLVLPNLVYLVVDGRPQPTMLMQWSDGLYVTAMSLYALQFVAGMSKSIKYV